jgi:hypothetical protein
MMTSNTSCNYSLTYSLQANLLTQRVISFALIQQSAFFFIFFSIILHTHSPGNLGQMAVDCLVSTLAQASSEHQVESLGLLQSEWVSAITGYEEFSDAWGRSLVMPVEGESRE